MKLGDGFFLLFLHSNFFKSWRNQYSDFVFYFKINGGFKSIYTSPYVHLSFVFGVIIWKISNSEVNIEQIGISILPSILGFSVAAITLIFAVSSTEIFLFLTKEGQDDLYFMQLIASILHYIVVQTITLIVCIVGYDHKSWYFNLLASILLMYCFLMPYVVGNHLFGLAKIFNLYYGKIKNNKNRDEK